MVELVDTPVLEAGAERCASSSLALGTKLVCLVSSGVEQRLYTAKVRGSKP